MFSRIFSTSTPPSSTATIAGSHPSSFKAARIPREGASPELVKVDWCDPQMGEVVVKVMCCGIAPSDHITQSNRLPHGEPISYPRTPGHERVGDIVAIGEGEKKWRVGQRVGGGWHGGSCLVCEWCRKGDFTECPKQQVNGVHRDGGMAEFVLCKSDAVIQVSDQVDPRDVCAGLDSGAVAFNALKHLQTGQVVLVEGVGGLAMACARLARLMGFHTVQLVPSSPQAQACLASEQYPPHEIIIKAQVGILGVVEQMKRMGGAQAVLCTSPAIPDAEHLMKCLSPGGTMILMAPQSSETLTLPLMTMIMNRLSIISYPAVTPAQVEQELKFAEQKHLRLGESGVKQYSLDQIKEAWVMGIRQDLREKVVVNMM